MKHLWGEIPAPTFLLDLSASEDFPSFWLCCSSSKSDDLVSYYQHSLMHTHTHTHTHTYIYIYILYFRFAAKLNIRYRDFLHILWVNTCTDSSLSTSLTRNVHLFWLMTLHRHLIITKVHSSHLLLVFYILWVLTDVFSIILSCRIVSQPIHSLCCLLYPTPSNHWSFYCLLFQNLI